MRTLSTYRPASAEGSASTPDLPLHARSLGTSEWREARDWVAEARRKPTAAPAPFKQPKPKAKPSKPKRLTLVRVRAVAAGCGLALGFRPYAFFDGVSRYTLATTEPEDAEVLWRGDRLTDAMGWLRRNYEIGD
jgi:hypothetical protein